MKQMLCLAAMAALAVARPEFYKEKEDFQFSRRSSDEGTKSGYYDAQRGNMGGNYEKSHNMDKLAQHQMSGLVKQVEGELGDGAETKTGSVFTAANSQGVYGSGRYDLSNLAGRNFQEGTTIGDSRAHSSLSAHNAGYRGLSSSHSSGYSNSNSQNSAYNSGYTGYGHAGTDQTFAAENLQAVDANYGGELASHGASYTSGYNSQSGYQGHNTYDASSNLHSSNSYGSNGNVKSRLISTRPVRIAVRPGSTVVVPVGAQTYDASNSASLYDQNSINTNNELLTTAGHQQINPANHDKHYESSYNYRKEWESHDSKPVAVHLAVPIVPVPKHSELYEDSLAHSSQFDANRLESLNQQSSNINSGYNANVKSAASINSHQQSDFNAQHHSASGLNSNAYTQSGYNAGTHLNSDRLVADVSTKPKSYQSSYSYHKSWERQGDPYVIQPASEALYHGQASQNLVANSHQSSYSHQYGGAQHKSHQGYVQGINGEVDSNCDDAGQIRVVRSNKPNDYETQEDLGQQTQSHWENLEDLGQQTQKNWEQHTQGGSARLEGLSQQNEQKWDNLADIGQQAQTNWNQHAHEGLSKLEDLGQQTQKHWEFQHQHGSAKLEDLGQNEDLGQETQKHLGNYRPHEYNNQQNMMESPQKPWYGEEKQGTLYSSDLENRQHTWKVYSEKVYSGENGGLFHHHDIDETQYQHSDNWNQQFEDNTQQVSLRGHWAHYNNDNQYQNQDTQYYMAHHWHGHNGTNYGFKLNGDTQTNKTIQSLWDRINTFEKESSTSNFNQQTNSESHLNGFSNFYGTDFNRKVQTTTTTNLVQNKPEFKNPINQWHAISTSTTEISNKNMHHINPSDIGRGDIGSEDELPISISTEAHIAVNEKPYKTPEEIEALSLTIKTNERKRAEAQLGKKINNTETQEPQSSLSVLSLHEQGIVRSATPEHNNDDRGIQNISDQRKYRHHNEKINQTTDFNKVMEEVPEELYQSNIDKQSQTLDQDNINLEQQHQAMWGEQQLEDLGQHHFTWGSNENFEQQADNIQELQSFANEQNKELAEKKQDNLNQQHTAWDPNDNLEQLNENLIQNVHKNKEIQTFGILSDKHDQQKEQIGLKDSTEQESQQLGTFWVPSENLEQQADNNQEVQSFSNLLGKHNQQNDDLYLQQHSYEQNNNKKAGDSSQQHSNSDLDNSWEQQPVIHQEIQNFAAISTIHDLQKDDFYANHIYKNYHKEQEDSRQHSGLDLNENIEQQEDKGQEVQNLAQEVQNFGLKLEEHRQQKDFVNDDKGIPPTVVNHKSQKQTVGEIGIISEHVSEKSGFWKSVGNKLTIAKDKVSSWFGRLDTNK